MVVKVKAVLPPDGPRFEHHSHITAADLGQRYSWQPENAMENATTAEQRGTARVTRLAGNGAMTLDLYREMVGRPEDEGVRLTLVSLLSDLHHLADAVGLDFTAAIRKAEWEYENETNEWETRQS